MSFVNFRILTPAIQAEPDVLRDPEMSLAFIEHFLLHDPAAAREAVRSAGIISPKILLSDNFDLINLALPKIDPSGWGFSSAQDFYNFFCDIFKDSWFGKHFAEAFKSKPGPFAGKYWE